MIKWYLLILYWQQRKVLLPGHILNGGQESPLLLLILIPRQISWRENFSPRFILTLALARALATSS